MAKAPISYGNGSWLKGKGNKESAITTPPFRDHAEATGGLIDRRHCQERAMQRADAAHQGQTGLGVLWINLDRFQQINRSFGHEAGDHVIACMAQRMRAVMGSNADLARMGSDEFVCLLAADQLETLRLLAETMLARISAPLQWADITLHPAASIGIAYLQPGEDARSLLQRADQAMLAAKRLGGKQCQLSLAEPHDAAQAAAWAREELEMENRLHRAMEQGGLQLHYQPIIRLDGRIEAVEALMRCQVDGVFLLPGRFIPIAERTGSIIRLGEWTLIEGALFARRMQDAGLVTKVAVNVSRAQLLAPQFAQAVHSALILSGIAPAQLELELTESLFMDMSETVQNNLRSAGEAGVGLAIDDFGTGYSCLSNLRDIHATKLKLDRAFVSPLPEDERSLAIVKAMTGLGQELGMTVVAEGVETQAQADALSVARVDAIQGFLYSRALPGDDLIPWLNARKQTNKNQKTT